MWRPDPLYGGGSVRPGGIHAFDSTEHAAAYAESIGAEAYRSRFIVIDYRIGETSRSDRDEIEQWIDGIHASS